MIMLTEDSDDSLQPLLIKDEEVAVLLGISRRTVWRLVSAGALPKPVKIRGNSRWRYQEIVDWVADLE